MRQKLRPVRTPQARGRERREAATRLRHAHARPATRAAEWGWGWGEVRGSHKLPYYNSTLKRTRL